MNIAYNINKNSNKQASKALSSQPVFGSILYFSCINLFLLLYLCSSIVISINIMVSMVYKNITSHAIDFNIITNRFFYFKIYSLVIVYCDNSDLRSSIFRSANSVTSLIIHFGILIEVG